MYCSVRATEQSSIQYTGARKTYVCMCTSADTWVHMANGGPGTINVEQIKGEKDKTNRTKMGIHGEGEKREQFPW